MSVPSPAGPGVIEAVVSGECSGSSSSLKCVCVALLLGTSGSGMIHGVAFERGFQSQPIFPPHRFEKCSSHQLQNGPEVQGKGGGGWGLRMPREEPLGSALACLSVFLAFLKEMWETGSSWLWARAALLCQGLGMHILPPAVYTVLPGPCPRAPSKPPVGTTGGKAWACCGRVLSAPCTSSPQEDSRKGRGSIFIQMTGAGSAQPGLQRNQCLLPRTGGVRFAGSPANPPPRKSGPQGQHGRGDEEVGAREDMGVSPH